MADFPIDVCDYVCRARHKGRPKKGKEIETGTEKRTRHGRYLELLTNSPVGRAHIGIN